MFPQEDIRLTQKYPAKEHARRVISCLKSEIATSSSPSSSHLTSGDDTGSKTNAVTGILYIEGQKSRLLEV